MIRSVKPYMPLSSLIMIYYSLFQSMLSYSIIFWGQASNSERLFYYRKELYVWLDMEIGPHVEISSNSWEFYPWNHNISILYYCLFQKVGNTLLQTMILINLQTRQSNNLFLPTSSLALYQKGVFFTDIKLFNKLPSEIKETIQTQSLFKSSLTSYLFSHSFYELEEFYTVNE
jgi:hypothetical protein